VNRRTFVNLLGPAVAFAQSRSERPPNVIVVYCDDLGYGDLGCYGSGIPTPNIDRIAAEGMRFTHCMTANPVCSPSRAGLLTGRYPTRVGVNTVFFPIDQGGLNLDERTLADMMKIRGYRTACVGKWHLGHTARFLPTARGFDSYYGIPYSNDMNPPVLMRNTDIIENAAEQTQLTLRYTAESLRFIKESKGAPFFLYLAHTYPHIPLHASERFKGKSPAGIYGDVLAELDWSTGELLGELQKQGIDRDTLLLFSSDNGPWFLGSPGRLRGRKGTTYEGGVRVPFLARWPGKIPVRSVCNAAVSTMDFLPTAAAITGAALPDKPLDGINIEALLRGNSKAIEREAMLYFDSWYLQCARWGPWKLHVARYNVPPYVQVPAGGRMNLFLQKPELYHLDRDMDESYDVAPEKPRVVQEIQGRITKLLPSFPEPVQRAWQETTMRSSAALPAGAAPRPAL
jgi:arylsulfatase A